MTGAAAKKPRLAPLLLTIGLFSVFSNTLMLTGPLFMLQVYDRVIASQSEETLVALFSLVTGLFALYGIFEFARGRLMAHVGVRLQSALSAPVFLAGIERRAAQRGKPAGTVQDLDNLRNILGSPIALAVFDLPWTPIFVFAIFIFHPWLGWLALAGGGILLVVAVLNQLLTAYRTRRASTCMSDAQSMVHGAVERSEYIWAQGMQDAATERFRRAQNRAVDLSVGATNLTGFFAALTKSFRLLLQSAMLALGAWLVLRQELTAGAMIAASILMGRALAPIDVAVGQWHLVQQGRRAWRDVRQALRSMPISAPPQDLPVPEGHLSVAGVSVEAAETGARVLQDISFYVAAGEAVGVIGPSGSGKSTLARVLTGLIAPAQGEVRLGGTPLGRFDSGTLGRHVGYLPQEEHLFDATIADNIAQLDPSPDPERIVTAARKARVHDIVLSLKDGYDTMIGPLSTRLSGGQRQRLALARALYNDPVLLVLDEPNSALDADGADALNQVVSDMKAEGKSVVIMTHRPTAIQYCDFLLVMRDGAGVAFGPRDEILRSSMKNADVLGQSLRKNETA